jgi:hypothetical protein
MKKILSVGLLLSFLFASVCLADSIATQGKNEQVIKDRADRAVTIRPKIKLDLGEGRDSNYKLTKTIVKLEYEVRNESATTGISVVWVNILNKTDKKPAWRGKPMQTIDKKRTGKWESVDMKHLNRPVSDSLVEIEIDCGGRDWYLLWDPSVSGKESLSVSETRNAVD